MSRDTLIVSQVAYKAAVDLVNSGIASADEIATKAEEIYAGIFELSQVAVAGAEVTPAPAANPVEQAAAAVTAAFPGTTATTAPGSGGSKDAMWKSALIDSPNDWWDNRTSKTNPKAPDFRAKNNGPKDKSGKPVALWIDSRDTPDWVAGQLSGAEVQF